MIETATGAPQVDEPVASPPPPPARPTLVRNRHDRVVAGVAAGLADYLGIDAALVRVAFIILAFAGGGGFAAYLIAWLVIPEAPADGGPAPARSADGTTGTAGASVVLGALLVLLGAAWLLDQVLPGLAHLTWPTALMLLGVGVILAGGRR